MLKKILLALVVVIGALCAFIATRPDTFHIERSLTMAAAPDAAFAQVNDFKAWEAWSPWEKLDPSMKKTFSSATAGKGATYEWTGNKDVGKGKMTIEESEPGKKVVIKLEFFEPWQATNRTTFTFAPEGAGTKVTWAMDGANNFVGKAFGLVMNMDQMIGQDFEKGLAAMKAKAEAAPPVVAAAPPAAAAEADEAEADEAEADEDEAEAPAAANE